MEIVKRMHWDELRHEYGLDGRRLLPWTDWTMPFGGGWCVVKPNTNTLLHRHDEQEMFIAIKGEAKIHIKDEIYPVSTGDLIAIPPDSDHYVENSADADFHFYTLWWDDATVKDFMASR